MKKRVWIFSSVHVNLFKKIYTIVPNAVILWRCVLISDFSGVNQEYNH